MLHQMPLLDSGTQRKRNDFSSDVPSNAFLMWHQMQKVLEDYGCGCVWAVPDQSRDQKKHDSQRRDRILLSNQTKKGLGEQGAAGYCPKILLLQKAKMVLCPFRRSRREICTRNRPISETNFLDDFWGAPFSPGLFVLLLICAFFSARKSGNFLHILGRRPH